MEEMTREQLILYNCLKNSLRARQSNWECVRQFYWEAFGVNLPKLDKMPSPFTIERQIRLLKSEYHDLKGDFNTQQAKIEKETEYKEMALDKNKPIKPQAIDYEEIELRWY